jgi:pyruvate dehydrogenase complex dehydrogenase (E1) component
MDKKNAVVSASDLCAAFRNHLTHTVGKSCETLAEGFGLAFEIAAQFVFLSLYHRYLVMANLYKAMQRQAMLLSYVDQFRMICGINTGVNA